MINNKCVDGKKKFMKKKTNTQKKNGLMRRQHSVLRANIHIQRYYSSAVVPANGRQLYGWLLLFNNMGSVRTHSQNITNLMNEIDIVYSYACTRVYNTTMPRTRVSLRLTMPGHSFVRYKHRGWMETVLGHTIDDNDDETIRMPARYKSVSEIHYFML